MTNGDGAVERGLELWVALLHVHAEQELRGLGRAAIVEGGIAPVVLELLHAPGVLADGVVPIDERAIAAEVHHVVPATGRVLAPDERARHLLGGLIVVVVAGGVIRVQEQVPHRRRARRLDPDLRVARLELAPPARQVGQIRPHVSALRAHLLGHEGGGALHRLEDAGAVGRLRPRGGSNGQHRQGHEAGSERELTCQAEHKVPD